ncbi:MAG: type II CRISPR-associated endonuclease Cas1 [Phycisphaeraceae bacterium]
MTDRILDIAESPVYLSVRNGLLCLRPPSGDGEEAKEVTVPLKELAAVVLTHPQITVTRTVLSGLAEAGAVLVACDDRFMPVVMALPLTGYHAPARRLAAQANAALPTLKRLWQQVVVAKVCAQAQVLRQVRQDDFGLIEMAKRVRSGDTDNIEAQAARIYWLALFQDVDFLRQPGAGAVNQNRFLDYGYAVLRAAVARAICAVGLHPGLGLHHHHRNNAFCLADDLMEPFRPLIDRAVSDLVADDMADAPMDKTIKARLIAPVMDRYSFDGEQRTLFDILGRLTSSLAGVFEERESRLNLPDIQ